MVPFALSHAVEVFHGQFDVLLSVRLPAQVICRSGHPGVSPCEIGIEISRLGKTLKSVRGFARELLLHGDAVQVHDFQRCGGERS